MSAIFQREVVLWGDFYSWLTNKMTAVGWVNISSKPSTDGDIFYSTGENNNTKIFIKLSNSGNVSSYISIECSAVLDYIPGESGKPGKGTGSYNNGGNIDPNYVYNRNYILYEPFNTYINKYVSVYFSINKDRIIISFKPDILPFGSTTYQTLIYFGQPTSLIETYGPQESIVLSNYIYNSVIGGVNCNLYDNTEIQIAKYSNNLFNWLRPSVVFLAQSGDIMVEQLIITSNIVGVRSVIEDILWIPKGYEKRVRTGSTFNLNGRKYVCIMWNPVVGNNISVYYCAYAFRTE